MKRIRKFIKKVIIFSAFLFSCLFIAVLFCNWRVESFAKDKVFYRMNDLPENKVGLLLGTSKRSARGRVNLYFKYRISAAVRLYKNKKVRYLIVSGDNRSPYYNEPVDMRNALLKHGVSKKDIFMDYAGLRTFDSVVRAKKIFGQKKITVISQRFHNKRAIYIADSFGIDAVGYNARDVAYKKQGMKVKIREAFARVWVFLDLYILKTTPRFLGKKIKIP